MGHSVQLVEETVDLVLLSTEGTCFFLYSVGLYLVYGVQDVVQVFYFVVLTFGGACV